MRARPQECTVLEVMDVLKERFAEEGSADIRKLLAMQTANVHSSFMARYPALLYYPNCSWSVA